MSAIVDYERSTYGWNMPGNAGAHAARLAANGCTSIWIKAGVDNPGLRTVWSQWSGGTPDIYAAAKVRPRPWFYVYPEQADVQADTICRALEARPADRIVLNAEVEWDDYAPSYVQAFVDGIRAALARRAPSIKQIGFSSVPSWDKGHGGTGSAYHNFPYEAWCQATDFSMPQAYFQSPDEILWENPRNTTDHPVIPILWAPGDFPGVTPPAFSDDALVAYARQVMGECEHFAGFSAWVAELPTYQFAAMQRCYQLLPSGILVPDPKEDTAMDWADIEREMQGRLTAGQLGDVEGRGWVEVAGVRHPLVEFQKGRYHELGGQVVGMFVDPANPASFTALEQAGKISWA